MARIVPKSRMTPGGYGSTSAPKRKQRAEGEKSPRKTKKSKKPKKKRAKRRAIQALTEYQGRSFHYWIRKDGAHTWTKKLKAPIDRTDSLFLLTDAGYNHDFLGKNPDERTPPLT